MNEQHEELKQRAEEHRRNLPSVEFDSSLRAKRMHQMADDLDRAIAVAEEWARDAYENFQQSGRMMEERDQARADVLKLRELLAMIEYSDGTPDEGGFIDHYDVRAWPRKEFRDKALVDTKSYEQHCTCKSGTCEAHGTDLSGTAGI